jgi:caffeoyl-CoA O-methyltransferase
MSIEKTKYVAVTGEVAAYIRSVTEPMTPEDEALAVRTMDLGSVAEMQIPHEQSVFLTMLARLVNARQVVEVGTFTGYSTIALARGLSSGGQVVTCEISDEWADIAQASFKAAGVDDQIVLKRGPAEQSLASLAPEASIDLAFIDADKSGYIKYWDLLVSRIRPGGILVVDNVLYAGEAANDNATGNAAAIRDFNRHAAADPRVTCVLLSVADGILLAQRKEDVSQAPEPGQHT